MTTPPPDASGQTDINIAYDLAHEWLKLTQDRDPEFSLIITGLAEALSAEIATYAIVRGGEPDEQFITEIADIVGVYVKKRAPILYAEMINLILLDSLKDIHK